MIVVAIIGILAAVALPAYQDYTKKARMSEVILAASACRTAITERVQSMSPDDIATAGTWGCELSETDPTSKYVDSIETTANGVVSVKVRNIDATDIDGKYVILAPYVQKVDGANTTSEAIQVDTKEKDQGKQIYEWRCGGGDAAATFLSTSKINKYLPGSCKSS